jgi:hypothetical protein
MKQCRKNEPRKKLDNNSADPIARHLRKLAQSAGNKRLLRNQKETKKTSRRSRRFPQIQDG